MPKPTRRPDSGGLVGAEASQSEVAAAHMRMYSAYNMPSSTEPHVPRATSRDFAAMYTCARCHTPNIDATTTRGRLACYLGMHASLHTIERSGPVPSVYWPCCGAWGRDTMGCVAADHTRPGPLLTGISGMPRYVALGTIEAARSTPHAFDPRSIGETRPGAGGLGKTVPVYGYALAAMAQGRSRAAAWLATKR